MAFCFYTSLLVQELSAYSSGNSAGWSVSPLRVASYAPRPSATQRLQASHSGNAADRAERRATQHSGAGTSRSAKASSLALRKRILTALPLTRWRARRRLTRGYPHTSGTRRSSRNTWYATEALSRGDQSRLFSAAARQTAAPVSVLAPLPASYPIASPAVQNYYGGAEKIKAAGGWKQFVSTPPTCLVHHWAPRQPLARAQAQ